MSKWETNPALTRQKIFQNFDELASLYNLIFIKILINHFITGWKKKSGIFRFKINPSCLVGFWGVPLKICFSFKYTWKSNNALSFVRWMTHEQILIRKGWNKILSTTIFVQRCWSILFNRYLQLMIDFKYTSHKTRPFFKNLEWRETFHIRETVRDLAFVVYGSWCDK